MERINKNPDIFTNKNFLLNLRDFPNSQKVMLKYKENFELIKNFIDSIIQSLLDNVSTFPYILRCICKIIKLLIDKKFPEINKYEKNALIGEFIFGKCILPILINSDINAVITSSILSANTKRCLGLIAKIIRRINRGMFFDGTCDTNFTIFNHYMVEIIPSLNLFYENLIEVSLPRILEEIISKKFDFLSNDNLSKSSEIKNPQVFSKYNYFKENEEELVNIQCICFSINDILLIIKCLKPHLQTIKNSSNMSPSSLNLLIKSVEKIAGHEVFLTSLLPNKYEPKRKFMLIFNVESNPDKMDLLYPKIFRFTFTNEIESEVILKRIKFCVKLILRGINMINPRVYSYLNSATSTKNFIIALNQILQMEEYTDTEFNDKIPLNWYSLYMTSNFQFLPDEYIQDDYLKLYEELLKEGLEEISFLNKKSNLIIAKYGMNTRCVEKIIEKIRRDTRKAKQIEKFIKMERFIRKTEINVCVKTGLKDEEKAGTGGSSKSFFGNLFDWSKRKTVVDNKIELLSVEDNV